MRSPIGVFIGTLVVAGLVGVGGAGAGWFAPDPTDPNVTLADVERWVSRRYPVPEIDPARLAELMARDAVVLLDVREAAEFAQSRIAGAIQVSPSAKASAVVAAAGDAVRGRAVVLYCSVGARSGSTAGDASRALTAAGATGVYNLTGGLFRWAREARAMVDGTGPTLAVHPYDAKWGKLLERTPRPAQ